jgi:hypothetical protein
LGATRCADHRDRPLDGLHELDQRRQFITPVGNQNREALADVGHARAHQLIALPRDHTALPDANPTIPASQQDDGSDRLSRLDEHSLHATRLDGGHRRLGLSRER